jgi:hypothetical protein
LPATAAPSRAAASKHVFQDGLRTVFGTVSWHGLVREGILIPGCWNLIVPLRAHD